jgi:hypothetical protein
MVSKREIQRLARRKSCPRCSLEKTEGTALCRRCRYKLPAHMRLPLEGIGGRDEGMVSSALRAAVHYLDVHYRSILEFGGGPPRGES